MHPAANRTIDTLGTAPRAQRVIRSQGTVVSLSRTTESARSRLRGHGPRVGMASKIYKSALKSAPVATTVNTCLFQPRTMTAAGSLTAISTTFELLRLVISWLLAGSTLQLQSDTETTLTYVWRQGLPHGKSYSMHTWLVCLTSHAEHSSALLYHAATHSQEV